MAKYCQKCGSSMSDNAAFCTNCGASFQANGSSDGVPNGANSGSGRQAPPNGTPNMRPVNQQPTYGNANGRPVVNQQPTYGNANGRPVVNQQPYGAQGGRGGYQQQPYGAPVQTMQAPRPQQKKSFPLVPVIAGGAGLVVLIIVLIILLSGGQSSPKAAFNKYASATKAMNYSKAADVDYSCNFNATKTKKEYVAEEKDAEKKIKETMPDYYKTTKEALKNAKYSVTNIIKLSKEEIEEKRADLARYGYTKTDKIKDIRKIEYTHTYQGSTTPGTCYAIKVGGKWYIYD